MVFKDQFSARPRFPCQDLVEEIPKAYNIEMHHLTPNGIAKIALFVWAVKSKDVNPDIKAFCALHEMHTQFSKNGGGKESYQILWLQQLQASTRCKIYSPSFQE